MLVGNQLARGSAGFAYDFQHARILAFPLALRPGFPFPPFPPAHHGLFFFFSGSLFLDFSRSPQRMPGLKTTACNDAGGEAPAHGPFWGFWTPERSARSPSALVTQKPKMACPGGSRTNICPIPGLILTHRHVIPTSAMFQQLVASRRPMSQLFDPLSGAPCWPRGTPLKSLLRQRSKAPIRLLEEIQVRFFRVPYISPSGICQ